MKKLVIVGAGQRCYMMFATHLRDNYADKVEIAGIYDLNKKRCEYYKKTINPNMIIFDDFDKMLDTIKPDGVLVTTKDAVHHEYIIRALNKGCKVYSEKPLTDTEEKCYAIRQAEKKAKKEVSVTFNCRFMPYFAKLKEIVKSGVIGKIHNVIYDYRLNNEHGGDYFKRWHRKMENCGGMLLHKSTHHFDIVNWLLEDEPASVIAQGSKLYYSPDNHVHAERCSNCPHTATCESYGKGLYEEDLLDELYFKTEDADGYIRDHCAFSGDSDIYDTMSVAVKYKNGTMLNYNLCMYAIEEGYTMTLIGEKGTIVASTFFDCEDNRIVLSLRTGEKKNIDFPKATGLHAGGDDRMLAMFFGGDKEDPLGQCAGSFDGITSAIIGIGANQSIKTGKRVELTPILDKMR